MQHQDAASTGAGRGRDPAASAGIPKDRYTSREFAEREWEQMWTKVWLLAGRASDIPEPGDYFTFEIGIESILVIRLPDGTIAARHNVCMHRGNRLRDPGRGHAEKFSCLFHGWEYALDGTLLCVLDPESFPQGTPVSRFSLRPVRCDTWAGFVFVSLNPDVEPLRDYLGIIPEHLDVYGFERWKIAFECTIEIDCNWKTSVDAFNEAYHISATHPWTIAFSDDTRTIYDCYDKHSRMIYPRAAGQLASSRGWNRDARDPRALPRARRGDGLPPAPPRRKPGPRSQLRSAPWVRRSAPTSHVSAKRRCATTSTTRSFPT